VRGETALRAILRNLARETNKLREEKEKAELASNRSAHQDHSRLAFGFMAA